MTPELILASASPRRRELLAELGVRFTVAPAELSEPRTPPAGLGARAWTEALAYFKARCVAERRAGHWVLGADTIVVCAGRLLGKPLDEREAREMLELQAREPADVITGVALVRAGEEGVERRLASAVTRVWMRDDPVEREKYLAGGDWAGKAGAYGLQDAGGRLVERIEGSFSNVVGLPLELLAGLLKAVAAVGGAPLS
jgi:septum formation protein